MFVYHQEGPTEIRTHSPPPVPIQPRTENYRTSDSYDVAAFQHTADSFLTHTVSGTQVSEVRQCWVNSIFQPVFFINICYLSYTRYAEGLYLANFTQTWSYITGVTNLRSFSRRILNAGLCSVIVSLIT